MGKDKLKRFAEVESFDNVIQPSMEELKAGFSLKGNWRKEFFKNDNPIVLELGCGKGEYVVGLSRLNPDVNYIGIDIKGARLWRGAKTCIEEGLSNGAFVRSKVDFVDQLFAAGEVNEIWLTFSDPQPKRPRKRLTSPLFIDRYKKILAPNGLVHIKTDSELLFEYTLEEIEDNDYKNILTSWDVYGELVKNCDDELRNIMEIKTFYEQKWLGMGIKTKYCKFALD